MAATERTPEQECELGGDFLMRLRSWLRLYVFTVSALHGRLPAVP